MVKLWAYRVSSKINEFADVPDRYKKQVAEVLIEQGYSDLVPSEYKS